MATERGTIQTYTNNYTLHWCTLVDFGISSTTSTTVTYYAKVKILHVHTDTTKHVNLAKGITASLTINGTQVKSYTSTAAYELYAGEANALEVINYSATVNRTSADQILSFSAQVKLNNWGKATSTHTNDTGFVIPATGKDASDSIRTNQRVSSNNSYVESVVNFITKNNAETFEIQVVNMQLNHSTGWKDSFTYSYGTTGTLQSGDSHISNSASVSNKQYTASATEQVVAGQTKTFKKAASAYNITLYVRMVTQSTTYEGSVIIRVPALLSMSVTATNGNATYNGSAHYAKIKVTTAGAAGATVSYGTSTSYGYTLTATNANTDYTLSSVSATNVSDSKTVYYKVTKTGYVPVTGSTTITISKAANSMTYAAQSWSCSFSTSAQTKTLNAAASAQGTVTYSLQSQKQGSTTVSYFTFNATSRVLTMAANTPPNTYTVIVRAHAAGDGNHNTKDVDSTITVTVSKATNPLAYTATQSYSKTFSTAAQTQATTAATGAQGTLSYAINSQKTGSTTVSYFSLSTTTLTVAANTPAGTYTVVIRATAAGNTNYNSAIKDSTITFTINKATPTLSVTGATLHYTGSAQTLVSAASVTGNGTIYYGLGSSTTSAPSSWSTTKPTATNVGTYYIWAKADASTNYAAVTQVYKATATIKPVMWLKYHVNGGTISDSPHKFSDTQYFKITNNLVQGSSTSGGTYTDVTHTINTGTTYLNLWNITSFNVTRTGYSLKSGAAAYNTAANGTGIDVNQDNTAAGDTNPITTQRLNGGTQITANVTKTLYVNWKANTYTVTLHANNGSGGTTSVTATYDSAMPSATMPTRAGYTFAGYYDTNATTGGTQYYTAAGASARTWNKTAATILYARWTANKYTITLNDNQGSGGSGSVQITYGTAKGSYPSITKPTRPGYTFAGYYSATSGGTQWYDANGNSVRTFDLTADTTWYAQWTINSYVLTIDPNGGTWNSSTSTSTASQNYATTKAIAAPTRTGYTFVGWAETGVGHLSKINQTDPAFDSSSGGVAIYNNSGGGTVTHTRQSSSAGTAYGSYEILISSSSGTTSPGNGGFYQPTTSAANKKYIHAFVAKIPTGYTVMNAQNATGDGRTITWLTDRNGTGAFRVYAYQHNCGSTGTFSTFGHVYIETGTKPMSWQLAYSAMKDITDGTADTYTYGAGAGRITALWAGNKYSVAFNANGGTGSMSTQTDFFYGTAKALTANGFTAPSGGYSFAGWATSAANAAAGTVAYANQANMTTGTTTNGGTVTLYAVWKRTITFKHGKANATTNTANQYYGGNVTPPTITAISTWTPLGWRDDTTAGAKEYGANNTTAFAYTSTVQTLYAVYSRTLTISYGANGGTGTTPSNTTTTQYYNTNGTITSPSVTLATNPYSQTGCTFSHWLVASSNTNVASGGSYTWSIAVDASTVSRVASAQWNITVTATNGNAIYNGSAHSASISIGIAGATVEYGTSTSYGYTLTATNANTNYSMSSASATTVAESKTVYYRVSKSGYLARTGSTTVTISKRTVTPTAPTLTTGTLTYDGTAKTLANAGSCTAGGQMYYYVGTSATAPAFSTSTWSTSISTQTSAGTYYIFWYCYVSDTANNNDTSSDNINITKSLGSRTIEKATLTITPTAYNADYNGVAHSAQIKCTNVDSVTIAYGTSTSYGNSLTATTRNTNYAMSSVTRTNPGTTTVYYKASKTNYNDVTGSTTITITGVPVHTKVNGAWKHGIVYVNVNGTWKKATAGYRNVNGTWKPIDK